MTARVAIIIPCHGDGRLVGEAVHSIREAEPLELVVVDDASRDGETQETLEMLRREGVRVLRHDVNRGVGRARRTGLAATLRRSSSRPQTVVRPAGHLDAGRAAGAKGGGPFGSPPSPRSEGR